ncbi:esterase-like activity of phytase family protein [Solirubrobacter soli]|uniref:esterase-like activity of phytase family protein n=1 Tax=Solirubrobacter soli TaxID=363832 RepID=UPI000A019477|nr:esterase-like activity of phytase family protein [Solirubrobacter soli]
MRATLATVFAVLLLAAPAAAHPRLTYLGQAIVPTGTTYAGTTVGGLSSITYDARRGVYYTLSDDPAAVRYYTVSVDLRDGRLSDGDVQFRSVTSLLAPGGVPYAATAIDPEGLALTKHHELVLTSEGYANTHVNPFVRRYSLDGRFLADFPVPQAFLPVDASHGVRQNLGFESAGIDGHSLYVGTENALVQDGPPATIANGSPARILRYDTRSGRLERQWTYVTDPVAEPPVPPTAFSVNGLVELLPLGKDRLIAMERSFSVGAPGTGNKIKLYSVSLDDRSGTARKTLLLNLDRLGIPLDNVEGLTFGPRVRGRQTIVLVSDNNFAATQFTQFLAFAL